MAYAQTTVSSVSTLVIGGIYDLQYAASQYILAIEIERSSSSGGPWTKIAEELFIYPNTTNKYVAIPAENQTVLYYYRTKVTLQYGGVVYDFTSPVVQMPKQNQSTPSNPTLSNKGTTYIQLNSISNGQYRINYGTAQTSTYFGGLTPTTSYTFQQRYAETATKKASNWSSTTIISTYYAPPPPATPSGLTAGSPARFNPGGLNLIWNSVSGAVDYQLRSKVAWYSYGYWLWTTNTYFSLYDLSFGTTNYISVRSRNLNGVSAWSDEVQLTTAPKIPTVEGVLDLNNNRVFLTISGMEGNWTYFRIKYRNITDNAAWQFKEVNTLGSHEVNNLLSGKQYEFKVSSVVMVLPLHYPEPVPVESVDQNGSYGNSPSIFFTIGGRPSNWTNWDNVIEPGSSVHSVIGKFIFIMPAEEWNQFTNRINDFRTYKGLSSYTFTNVSYFDDVTLAVVNEALNAIRGLSLFFTGGLSLISNRNTDHNILDSNIYINMKTCLNSIL
jgi:hypothetical protein